MVREALVSLMKRCGACETDWSFTGGFPYTHFLVLMSFSMTTLTVDEIVGKLTKAEVIACLPMRWILGKDRRNWKCLKDVVGLLSDDMKKSIYDAACTKWISPYWRWKTEKVRRGHRERVANTETAVKFEQGEKLEWYHYKETILVSNYRM